MRQLLKTFAIFALADAKKLSAVLPEMSGSGHRGEQTDFYPSENLENSFEPYPIQGSCERGKGLKAVPPVECIYDRVLRNTAHIHNYRCELIFILSFTGIPEPSGGECHEGSHFVCVY